MTTRPAEEEAARGDVLHPDGPATGRWSYGAETRWWAASTWVDETDEGFEGYQQG